ncbi:hypothetical protein [Catellatospora chokoriensis]|uniref:Excreted virulence factor EspC (Type VII ESX diderm) n=1 Tax=Catellatospora chokoriensis TaxID=310353 RepID=A0A8J3NND9_9ACTN|nr:hypothetical protein [Catellatospora chokoriensis]GIF86875.1 hypothetical protein Cch02nite_03190 [Catellatospora chokoriensis]
MKEFIPVRQLSWPGGDGTHLDLDLARDAGGRMTAAGKDVTALRNGAGASIESAGSAKPWGTDDVGNALDKGYSEIAPNILALLRQVGTALESMGGNITQAATVTSDTDVAASKRTDQAGNHQPDIPV